MGSRNMLCSFCGDLEVRFLLVEKLPEWLASEKIRKMTGGYRVEPYCEQCVSQPQNAGAWIVSIERRASPR